MRNKQIQNFIKVFFLDKLHLLKVSELDLSQQTIKEFDEIYENCISKGNDNFISYKSGFSKYLFLNYIIENKNVLVHGSNNPSIDSFEPKQSSLFNGNPIKAVFASSDGIWSSFFAVFNRTEHEGSIRNLCLTVPTKKGIKRYYYFSINKNLGRNYWTDGTIYFFPKNLFKQGAIRDEWVCESEVKPLARLSVNPSDFF